MRWRKHDREARLTGVKIVLFAFQLTHRQHAAIFRCEHQPGWCSVKPTENLGQAVAAAGVGAALLLSVSAGQAQSSGPFAGFDGAWSGTGTVALSNGTTEHIRCKADYKVNATGMGLKQNLHCASDSYKFDLSSDVTSQGERISGNWSEKSRNIFGNLQGTAGSGQIDVFVEASGFAANLNLRTNGNKQVVQIDSKGEIRGVTITMTKG